MVVYLSIHILKEPSFYLSVEKIQSSPNLYLKAYTFKDKEIVKDQEQDRNWSREEIGTEQE